MIQMIVMDMDGTLLTSDNRISSRTKELLLRVQSQGVRLVLASGRSYCKLMEYAEEDVYKRQACFISFTSDFYFNMI